MEEKKTHRLVEKPRMSVRFLADYMAASDQARRTIVRDCKYRAIGRLVQHDDAKLAVAKYMLSGAGDPNALLAEADYIRNKLADDQFDTDCNHINADYVVRFAAVAESALLPKGAEWLPASPYKAHVINGLAIPFAPNLLVQRIAKNNKVKRGALMLRYKKGTPLKPEVAAYQSAAIHGLLDLYTIAEDVDVERGLCVTLCAHTGELHPAPGDAISRFNNTKAACATIADAWDNVKPPKGAII